MLWYKSTEGTALSINFSISRVRNGYRTSILVHHFVSVPVAVSMNVSEADIVSHPVFSLLPIKLLVSQLVRTETFIKLKIFHISKF